MISCKNLTKSFYHKPVFHQITFNIEQESITALLGKNGAGKSTLLRILSGLTSFDGGEVNLDGTLVKSSHPESRSHVFYVGHSPGLYPPLSAVQNIRIASQFYGLKLSDHEISDVLSLVGLSQQAHDTIRIFSQGMMQRLKLALASVMPWKILLFDEPFTGLDEEGRKLTESMMGNWKKSGRTIVVVVHDHHWALENCDRVIVLHNKSIGIDGSARDVNPDRLKSMLGGKH